MRKNFTFLVAMFSGMGTFWDWGYSKLTFVVRYSEANQGYCFLSILQR